MNCTKRWHVRAGKSSRCVDVHPRNSHNSHNLLMQIENPPSFGRVTQKWEDVCRFLLTLLTS